ncbi:MAG: transglutaminase domain-containing protein, partial [Armatimonadetes bacterium]|nr:transglutaminase domain-containing protein [Armatimonadota bacterium]
MEKARGIYEAVTRQVAYDKSAPGYGRGDTRRACLLGKGNCTDFHSLFLSMARAAQIPSRFKIGVVIPPPDGFAERERPRSGRASGAPSGGGIIPQDTWRTIPGYHCWAEFYEPWQGWVPVDASEAWKHPELADY